MKLRIFFFLPVPVPIIESEIKRKHPAEMDGSWIKYLDRERIDKIIEKRMEGHTKLVKDLEETKKSMWAAYSTIQELKCQKIPTLFAHEATLVLKVYDGQIKESDCRFFAFPTTVERKDVAEVAMCLENIVTQVAVSHVMQGGFERIIKGAEEVLDEAETACEELQGKIDGLTKENRELKQRQNFDSDQDEITANNQNQPDQEPVQKKARTTPESTPFPKSSQPGAIIGKYCGNQCEACQKPFPYKTAKEKEYKRKCRDLFMFQQLCKEDLTLKPYFEQTRDTSLKVGDQKAFVLKGWKAQSTATDVGIIDPLIKVLVGDRKLPRSWSGWKEQRPVSGGLCHVCWNDFFNQVI